MVLASEKKLSKLMDKDNRKWQSGKIVLILGISMTMSFTLLKMIHLGRS